MIFFEFELVDEEMSFKNISHLQLWQPFNLAGKTHLCYFGRGHYAKHVHVIILNFE